MLRSSKAAKGPRRARRIVIAALAAVVLAPAAMAEDLTIAIKATVTNADPHLLYTPNRNVQKHVYETLVSQDANVRPVPGLATSWEAVEPTVWEFQLDQDAMFQDGTPLTPEDVIFSIQRAQTIEGTRTFRAYVKDVASVEKSGPHSVRITTKQPAPELPANLATIAIVAKHAVEGASPEEFNGGSAAIGTGPYSWVKFTPGQDVVLVRNDAHAGEPGEWDKITFQFIPDDSARVAALLSGSADVIDSVPAGLFGQVESNKNTNLLTATSLFVHYMSVDRRETSPFVTDLDGNPMDVNPFNDKKVREAMTHAINREALADIAMEGAAAPAGQFMPEGFDGNDPDLKPVSYAPELSKKLLAEAGYPDGFGFTIHCLNDRFSGDVRTCQAIAQMLTAVGIQTKVDAIPSSVMWSRATGETPEFSSFLAIFGSAAGLASNALNVLVQEWDTKKGTGRSNSGRYENDELNALIKEAAATIENEARQELLRKATRMAIEDQAVLPIFFLKGAWGLRNGLTMEPRGDMYTLATSISASDG